MTIDDLARMVKGEFDNIGGEIKKVKSEIQGIKNEMAKGFKESNESHERLELRMSNVAYRFEVDDLKNQLNSLRQRVDFLEHK